MAEGWLGHYLDFAGQRLLPPMPKLLEAPFWLDPSDPHLMAAVMQIAARPMPYDYYIVSGDWRHTQVGQQRVWGTPSTASRPRVSAPSRRSTRPWIKEILSE